MKAILWYAVWGMYRGMVGRKTSGELLVLISIALLFGFFASFTFWSILPGIFFLLLFFLYIAIRRARERIDDQDST